MNYYLRLYITDSFTDEKIIIYAYAVEVEKGEKQWSKATLLKKPKLLALTCIMNEEELARFCKSLEREKITISINEEEISLKAHLVKRPKVLTPPKEGFVNEAATFINQLTTTESYWNINKDDLIQRILSPYEKDNDRRRRELFNRLLNTISDDVGMDFKSNAASKLGNVEIYTLLLSDDFFDISVDKKRNGKALNIRKCKPVDFPLIIRFRLKNGNECISDCIKEMDTQEISIETQEPISHIEIQMWNKNTGQLAYMKSVGLIRQIHMTMSILGQSYKSVDPWSSELRKSFSKGEKVIDNIENVNLSHIQRPSATGDYDEDKWVEAGYQAIDLIGMYVQTKSKGAFCKKFSDKTGEIDSFLRILGYLSESRVTYAILVDPFFSVKAAAKLLSRISNASMTLEIITSLTDNDPDNGGKNCNIVFEVEDFIKRNKGVFHKNLIVWNIVRGGNQAFHDRYLLRVFEDGTTDGYLLSNSLNSAGQSYPFVIAPMEKDVTYEVKEYLRELKELGKVNKEKNLISEIIATEIWNSKNQKFPEISQNYNITEKNYKILELIVKEAGDIQQLLQKAVEKGFVTKGSSISNLEIAAEKKQELLEALFKTNLEERGEDDSKHLLKSIGEMLYYCHGFYIQDIVEYITGASIDKNKIAELIKKMSIEVDREILGDHIDIYDEKQKYRHGLKFEEAIDNKISYAEAVFIEPPHIYDSRIAYMQMMYRLLMKLMPEKCEEILAETASPLMFGELMRFIAGHWDENLYLRLTNSSVPSLKEISYVWLWKRFDRINEDGGNTEEFIERILRLPGVNSVYQLAYVISGLTYSVIYNHKNYEDIKNKYLKLLGYYLEKIELEGGDFQLFISLLSGRQEAESSCDLLDLYEYISVETNTKNELLMEVIRRLKSKLEDDGSYYFSKSDWKLTQCAAGAIFYLKGIETAKYISEEFLRTGYFSTYSIPFLRDRDYGKWNIAALKSVWQLILITDLVAIDKVPKKEIIIQKAISLFTDYLVPEIWQWHDRDDLASEFIRQLALWVENGLLSSEHIGSIKEVFTSNKTPGWASLYFYLVSGYKELLGESTLEKIRDIVCETLASNELGDRRLLRLSLGELIIYRLKQEEQPELINWLRDLKDLYVGIWMKGEKEYNSYLNWLETFKHNDEYLQWKERGIGYVMIKNAISGGEGR